MAIPQREETIQVRAMRFFVGQKNHICVCLLIFSFALLVTSSFADQIVITPKWDLSSVQASYSYVTNRIDCGMFREAEHRIKYAVKTAMQRLDELDKRGAADASLKAFVVRIQNIRERFDDNWTNAVFEICALETPVKDFVATNDVVKEGVEWRLKAFQWLKKDVKNGNKQDAMSNMYHLQKALEWEIEAFEALKSCEEEFRAVLVDFERARERLEIERAKPLDAQRALRIAWDYYAETTNRIAGPRGSFAGAFYTRDVARAYLQDIRRIGVLGREVDELWKALDATQREENIAGARYYIGEAKEALENHNPVVAKREVETAKRLYVSRLTGDPAYDGYVAELGELKRAAEQMDVEQRRAREPAEIK